jgi:hypothetical protein
LAGALGGPDGINSLAVFPSSTWKTAFHFKVREIEIEESLSQLRAVHRMPQFAGMFLGLGLFLRSPRTKTSGLLAVFQLGVWSIGTNCFCKRIHLLLRKTRCPLDKNSRAADTYC